jgi:phosphoglycolate phosphatase
LRLIKYTWEYTWFVFVLACTDIFALNVLEWLMDYTGYIGADARLCVFDLDGTLVDTLEDLALSVNWILGECGLPAVSRETVKRAVGNGALTLLKRCFAESVRLSKSTQSGGKPYPGDEAVARALEPYRAYYDAHCADHATLYPGICEWLGFLSARSCALAVLTNKPANAATLLLRALGVDRFFRVIAGPETYGVLKPDPAGLVAIMAKCDIPRSSGAACNGIYMIGDSVVDILTARNAGVIACGITGGLGDDGELVASRPDILIERRN